MTVAVSLVSFNTKEILKKTLSFLTGLKGRNDLAMYVLDNHSDDGSAEMIEKEFPKVKLIKSDQNTGFAKGQNMLLKQVSEEFVLILNPDTEISPDSIDQMVEFMEKNPNCGIASCRIRGTDGSLHSNGGDLPFGLALVCWLYNLEFLGDLPNFHAVSEKYYKTAHEVGWVGGTFMMVRREVFEKIGYFDEKYFMYFEDVDLCFRAKKKGFTVMINPDVEIKHISGASSKNPRFTQWKGELQGLLIFYKNQASTLAFWWVKLMVFKSTMLRILAFALIGKFDVAKTYGKIITEL